MLTLALVGRISQVVCVLGSDRFGEYDEWLRWVAHGEH